MTDGVDGRPDPFFRPISGTELPRYAGPPTFLRLPHVPEDHPRRAEVEVGILGMPWDGGTSNRPGARHGPRALRDASTMLREANRSTGQTPTRLARCADLGDVAMNPVDQPAALGALTDAVAGLRRMGVRPLCVGGDHLCSLAVLEGLSTVGDTAPALVLLDSHTDLNPPYLGDRFASHGNPFRIAVEKGLIDPTRSTMMGMRGTAYGDADFDFAAAMGIEVVTADAMMEAGIAATMVRARDRAGYGPTWLSFDVDFVDPAFAPGTGTPEVGGPTSREALAAVRALHGLRLIGADLVEVSPPFDVGGVTAWLGATLMFELLCAIVAGPPIGRRRDG